MEKKGPKKTDKPIKSIPGLPPAPKSLDAIGKRAWKEITSDIDSLGLLSKTDSHAIELYCYCYSRQHLAEQEIQQNGTTYILPSGVVKPHPAVAIANEAGKQKKALLEQFALTPRSRQRIETTDQSDDDGGGKWANL